MPMAEQLAHLPFLIHGKHHLSPTKAREAVIAVLRRCGEERPADDWDSVVLTWKGNPPIRMTFAEMVKEARETGVVRALQFHFDKKDSVFGGTYVEEFATPNYQIHHHSEWAGFVVDQQGPCRAACVEIDLTEDILTARRLASQHSNEYNFVLTCRYFRNYLSACISLVDAFINRHIHVAKAEGFTSPEFEQLQKTTGFEKKLELWWAVCCTDDISTLLGSVHYCRLQELRAKRNIFLHALEPIAGYSLLEMQIYLNKVRSGVGELLLLLRKAHRKPTLGFIERLRTAPKVAFHKVHLRSDGDRVDHVKQD